MVAAGSESNTRENLTPGKWLDVPADPGGPESREAEPFKAGSGASSRNRTTTRGATAGYDGALLRLARGRRRVSPDGIVPPLPEGRAALSRPARAGRDASSTERGPPSPTATVPNRGGSPAFRRRRSASGLPDSETRGRSGGPG